MGNLTDVCYEVILSQDKSSIKEYFICRKNEYTRLAVGRLLKRRGMALSAYNFRKILLVIADGIFYAVGLESGDQTLFF